MHRILVVYFSRTGFTRRIADEIAARGGAELDAIEDIRARTGFLGYFRSAREAYTRRLIEIRAPAISPSGHDLIVLGTPVWAGNVSSPMRSYIALHGTEFKQVAFFCTQGGSGAEKVFKDMAELCGREPVASLALSDREINRGDYNEKLDGFVKALASVKAA